MYDKYMTKSLTPTTADLKALLDANEGDYVAAYNRLVKSVGEELTAVTKRSTIADRSKRWYDAVKSSDRGALAKINKNMKTYLQKVRAQTIGMNEEPRLLTETEADDLMEEFLALRDIQEFLTVRKDKFIREAVFAHLDIEGKESGRVETTLGHDFCRDAVSDADPDLDREALKADLTPEQVAQVFKEKVVVTEEIDYEALMKLVDLETLRTHLKPGKPRSARFAVRASKATTEK